MGKLFLSIFNMSLTASIIIVLVLLARLCLRKAPKIYSYILWSVVLFRLLCPVTITAPASVLSLFSASSESGASEYTTSMQYISPEFTAHYEPTVPETHTPVTAPVNNNAQISYTAEIQEAEKQPTFQRSAKEIALTILGWLWLAGVVVFVGYTSLQYIQLNRRLKFAYRLRGNIFESDEIETAFVLGVFSPRIYLPCGLSFDVQKAVIAHEQTHQRRGDHVVKILAYLALALHWFNPLVWLSFKLACDDMEKSCDEAVLRNMRNRGYEEKSVKAAYGQMLYALGSGQRNLFSPVSFAETGIKGRVKNVLGYRRLTRAMSVVLSMVLVAALAACVVNPAAIRNKTTSASDAVDDISREYVDEIINISGTRFPESAEKIELLNYYGSDVSDIDISELKKCQNLKSISYFEQTAFSMVPNLSVLEELPELESFYVSASYDISALLTVLSKCNKLKYLALPNCYIDDLSAINSLTSLERLDLTRVWDCNDNQYSLESILSQISLPNLKDLSITVYLDGNSRSVRKDDIELLNAYCAEHGVQNLRIDVEYLFSYVVEQNIISSICTNDNSPLGELNNIVELSIDGYSADLNFLSHLDNLEILRIYLTSPLDGKILKNIKSLKSLTLWVPQKYIDEPFDYSFITALSGLQELYTNVYSNDISFIYGLTELKKIDVSVGHTKYVPNVDFGMFKNPANIEYLIMSGNYEHTEKLSEMTSLTHLELYSDGEETFTFDCSVLAPCKQLNWLHISAESFDFLETIGNLPSLRTLDITLYAYDEAVVKFFEQFKADNPLCDVTYQLLYRKTKKEQ